MFNKSELDLIKGALVTEAIRLESNGAGCKDKRLKEQYNTKYVKALTLLQKINNSDDIAAQKVDNKVEELKTDVRDLIELNRA